MLADAAANQIIDCWPENWPSFTLFFDLRNQWRTGLNGPTGMDFSTLYRELDERGITGEDRELLKADMREMERAALAARYAE